LLEKSDVHNLLSDLKTEVCTQAKRMVREADTDGDGLVSKDEFLNLLQQTSVPDSLDQ
jgi:hypothetical protein